MRRDRTRLARRGLLVLVLAVAGAVAWSLRKPSTRPAGPPASGRESAGAEGTTVVDGALMRFKAGEQKIEVKWRAMAGREGSKMRLQGVEVGLPYEAEGKARRATIVADECLYEAQPQKASFKGHVRVRTDDGLELDTESLDYSSEDGVAETPDPVAFRRPGGSGTAVGMEYRRGSGLTLRSEVRLHLEEEGSPPTEIEAGSARASREERQVMFEGGISVHQGARELRAQRLQLSLTEDLRAIERAAAIEDVDLRTGTGASLPGAPADEGGAKRLRCRRLNIVWRTKGVLLEAIAVNAATLEIEPGPRDARERRRVAAPQIRFDFDELGRLASLQGLPARQTDDKAPRFTVLTAEPLPAAGGAGRRVQSDSFHAGLDPASGALRTAVFAGAVAFSEPGRKAWAERALFEDGTGLVTLSGGEPRIVDEEQGSELRAKEIRLGTRTRSATARENVRHTIRGKGRPGALGPLAGEEPTVLLCRDFAYDPASRTASYRDNALLRSGKDEIRAPLIVLEDAADGQRKLSASGGVSSTLHPRPEKGSAKVPQAVEARSREMLYEEKARRIVYTGDVDIRQGDIQTRSPEAIVLLTADGGAMDRLLAGSPVEVRQGERRASGERGTYTPRDETLVLVGEKVVLQDLDRRLEGRSLTFQVGSDRIRVDGREEVRTEAVFKRKELRKP